MIIDKIRNKHEFKRLYRECGGQKKNRKLRHILDLFNHNCAFCFYHENNTLGGCIYIENIGNKIFISGFSRRKHFTHNIEAINAICNYLRQDVYAQSGQKSAILLLRKAQFINYKKNIYVRKYKNG